MKITKEILFLKTNNMFEIMIDVEIVEAKTADLFSLTSEKFNTMITGQFKNIEEAKESFAKSIMNKLFFWQTQGTLLLKLENFGFKLKPQHEHLKNYSETGSFNVVSTPLNFDKPKLNVSNEIKFNNFEWGAKKYQQPLN